MAPKPLEQWSADNVVTWICAIGLGEHADEFKENAVDGNLLASLSKEDLSGDLGLSPLQAKKVLLEMDFVRQLTSGGGGGADPEEIKRLEQELQAKNAEIADLKAMLQAMQPTPAERAPAPAPAPKAAPPPPSHRNEHYVVRGAAGGAAKGAVAGAVGKYCCRKWFESCQTISLISILLKHSRCHCGRSCGGSKGWCCWWCDSWSHGWRWSA
jgi:hypothetical protein